MESNGGEENSGRGSEAKRYQGDGKRSAKKSGVLKQAEEKDVYIHIYLNMNA